MTPAAVLVVTGNEAHKWHNWEKSTARIVAALRLDPRIKVDITTDIEDLGRKKLGDRDDRLQQLLQLARSRGISPAARAAFVGYVRDEADWSRPLRQQRPFTRRCRWPRPSGWPEYRRIVRRVWNHTPPKSKPASGHDAFSPLHRAADEGRRPTHRRAEAVRGGRRAVLPSGR
ncbi:MAG: hypothetical protein U0736_08700 [Gemmataceae bacterium]